MCCIPTSHSPTSSTSTAGLARAIALTAGMLAATALPAQETQAPTIARDAYARMKFGIMVTSAWYESRKEDVDTWASTFDVEQFANDVGEMGIEYVVFTAWHKGMNPLYPSQRMDRWRKGIKHTPDRDLIADMHKALAAKGVALILYSHPNDGHDFNKQDQISTGHVDKDPTKWNDFINDMYDEYCGRYGTNLFGHWLDVPYRKADPGRLGHTIRAHHPGTAIIINNRSGIFPKAQRRKGVLVPHEEPYGKNVFYASEWKRFDDPINWPCIDGQVVNVLGIWWQYRGGSSGGKLSEKQIRLGRTGWKGWPGHARFTPEQILRYTAFQASCSRGGGACWAMGFNYAGAPYWEINVKENLVQASKLMKPFREAICGTLRSAAWPTPVKTTLADLPWGGTATSSPDGRYTYLSIFTPPKGNTLVLPAPADGAKFTAATMLDEARSPAQLTQNDNGVTITIGGTWDGVLPVIRLAHE